MGSEMYKVRWPKSFCNNHHKHCCTTGNDTCPHASSWLPSSNLNWNVCRQERNKISSRQQYLYECHSCQVCGWQEAWVHHKDATNVERHDTKAMGFLSINSPQSKEQGEVLSGIPCRWLTTDPTYRSKGSPIDGPNYSQHTNLQDGRTTWTTEDRGYKSVQTADEIVAGYPEVFQGELGALPETVHLEVEPCNSRCCTALPCPNITQKETERRIGSSTALRGHRSNQWAHSMGKQSCCSSEEVWSTKILYRSQAT